MTLKPYQDFLEQRQNKRLLRTLADDETMPGNRYVDFASNDYLDLSLNTAIIQAGSDVAFKYGAGATASRFVVSGHKLYGQVEQKLAQFKKKQASFLAPSGFQTNIAVISALLNKEILGQEPLVFFDKLNHASMYQALKLAGVTPIRYKHNDMAHLAELLKKHARRDVPIFMMTESVFSMDGDVCPLADFIALAQQYGAMTVVDDAHSFGILGEQGRGLTADYPEIDVVIGTVSKAFGLQGGYVVCSQEMMNYLYNAASGFIYSTGVTPFIWGAVDYALDLMPDLDPLRKDVLEKAEYLRKKLNSIGIDTLGSTTQIVPAVFKDNQTVLHIEDSLKRHGFLVKAIRYPTVPADKPRLRLTLKPAITYNHIDNLISVIKSNI